MLETGHDATPDNGVATGLSPNRRLLFLHPNSCFPPDLHSLSVPFLTYSYNRDTPVPPRQCSSPWEATGSPRAACTGQPPCACTPSRVCGTQVKLVQTVRHPVRLALHGLGFHIILLVGQSRDLAALVIYPAPSLVDVLLHCPAPPRTLLAIPALFARRVQ